VSKNYVCKLADFNCWNNG